MAGGAKGTSCNDEKERCLNCDDCSDLSLSLPLSPPLPASLSRSHPPLSLSLTPLHLSLFRLSLPTSPFSHPLSLSLVAGLKSADRLLALGTCKCTDAATPSPSKPSLSSHPRVTLLFRFQPQQADTEFLYPHLSYARPTVSKYAIGCQTSPNVRSHAKLFDG